MRQSCSCAVKFHKISPLSDLVIDTRRSKKRRHLICSIPGSGRSPGGGHGNPFQYSYLENPTDRGAWCLTVHRVTKSQTQLKQLSTYSLSCPEGGGWHITTCTQTFISINTRQLIPLINRELCLKIL